MNKLIVILSLLAAFIFFGCSSGITYAEQLKAEQKLIDAYIKRNNIKTVKTMPKAGEWTDNLYYQSPSGLYFHLSEAGEPGDSAEQNNRIIMRYIEYTLDAVADTIFNWNTIDFTYPPYINYLDYSQGCDAWHEAISYMKFNNSYAKLIVPSTIGTSTAEDDVMPIGYDFRIKIQK
jgi:hypothetical protein